MKNLYDYPTLRRCIGALGIMGAFVVPAAAQTSGGEEFVRRPQQLPANRFGKHLVEASSLIRASQARSTYNVNGAGLTVAVLDTGIYAAHRDFGSRVIAQRNFTSSNGGVESNANDGDGHGTHVSGIVVANGVHTGIAPSASVAAVKVLSDAGSSEGDSVNDGLRWVLANRAALRISVVNLSLGGSTAVTSTGESTRRDLIRSLRDVGVVVTAAAGNEYADNGSVQGMNTTAIIPETVSVGAVFDADLGPVSFGSGAAASSTGPDRITPFSNRLSDAVGGSFATDVFAPGGRITSTGTTPDGSANQFGTSQATPVTAGAILLMQQAYRNRHGSLPSVAQIESALRSSAVIINDGDDEDDNVVNTGANYRRVDVVRAIAAILGTTPPPVTPTPTAPPTTRPANDDFERAQVLAGASGQTSANTTNATAQSGEPTHLSTFPAHHSVWYRYTPTATGTATFSTFSNSFDTIIAAHTGSAFSNLTRIASNDDFGGVSTSSITINTTRGVTYYIAVDGYGTDSFGGMNLRFSATGVVPTPTVTSPPVTVPVNDAFARPQVLAGASGRVAGNNAGATIESGEPQHTGGASHSVWYRWNAPTTGNVVFTLNSANFAATIYGGTTLNALTRVGSSAAPFAVRAGTNYFIAVDGVGSATGAFALNWQMRTLPTIASISPLRARPMETVTITGTNFVGVTSVTVRGVTANLRVQSATTLLVSVPLTATTGPVVVTTSAGVSNAIGLQVIALPLNLTFSPSSGAPGTQVTVTGLNLGTTRGVAIGAPATFRVVDANTLIVTVPPRAINSRIVVQNIFGTNSSAGTFLITASIGNDNFAGASVLSSASGQISANNSSATAEQGEPTHWFSPSRSLWYRWTAPVSGQIQFNTANASFDSVIAIYSGNSLSTLTQLAKNDDNGASQNSSVSISATAGTPYYIAVDCYSSSTIPGTFTLRWGAPTAPQSVATNVKVSSTKLNRAAGTLTLNFVRAVTLPDEAFGLEIDGVSLPIESIARNGASVVLGFDATKLSGDTLRAVWSGRDANGATIVGETTISLR